MKHIIFLAILFFSATQLFASTEMVLSVQDGSFVPLDATEASEEPSNPTESLGRSFLRGFLMGLGGYSAGLLISGAVALSHSFSAVLYYGGPTAGSVTGIVIAAITSDHTVPAILGGVGGATTGLLLTRWFLFAWHIWSIASIVGVF